MSARASLYWKTHSPHGRLWRLTLLASLTAAFLLAAPDSMRAPPAVGHRVRLRGFVRNVAQTGDGSIAIARVRLSIAEAATPQPVALTLRMRNFAELESRVDAGEIIPREEMARRYLPRANDAEKVARWLSSQGLAVQAPGPANAVILARGTPTELESAFETNFARVTFQGAEYTAALSEPSLPAEIEPLVDDVRGLQPFLHPRKTARIVRKASPMTPTVAPPFLVGDILRAYGAADIGYTGAGQGIGVIIDTAPRDSDLTQFWSANGTRGNLANIVTVNLTGATLPPPTGEETLDVAWCSGVAPGAEIVIYACGDFSNLGAAYGRILDDLKTGAHPDMHQITMSFGAGELTQETEATLKAQHRLFTAIAAHGVTLFASAGDYGSHGMGGSATEPLFPATDPYVTGVGGTSLYLDGSTGAVTSESAWSPKAGSQQASGGGVSSYFARPTWQLSIPSPGGAMRCAPDVSLAADPDTGAFLVLNGQGIQLGGTSWSTPCWAGLCALINEARASAGQGPLGAANARLYSLASTGAFRDIISGNNGAYTAGAGYDPITGIGVPVFNVLLDALAPGIAPAQAPLGTEITSPGEISAEVGAAFSYRITARHGVRQFGASVLPAGWAFDPAQGLIAGTPTAEGVYPVTITVANKRGVTSSALVKITAVKAGTLPAVTSKVSSPEIAVDGNGSAKFTLHIPARQAETLYVNYTLAGSAENGTDYARIGRRARIKAGRMDRAIKINPQGDLGGAARKSVQLSLQPGVGYLVGTPGVQKMTIVGH